MKYFLGVQTPQIFDGHTSVKCFQGLHPQITHAWACVKYLTDMHPSNILGVYTPQITDTRACVRFLTDMHPSNILGVYTPR